MEFNFEMQPGLKKFGRQLLTVGKPLISIVTPYYNAGKYIRQTANCIFNQTFPHYEWIIVNDGSTNAEDLQIIEALANEDARVKVVHKTNGGAASARNLGIKNAGSDLIATLDSDDLIEPTYLECAYFALLTNHDASWCYSDSVGFQIMNYLWKKPFNTAKLKNENFLVEVAVIRKKALEAVGFYDESEKFHHEDWHLWLKLLSQGMYPVHMSFYGCWYRRLDHGVMQTINNDPGKSVRAMEMINRVAHDVDDRIKAVEYPIFGKESFKRPTKWNWDRPAITNNNKCKVLLILPWMVMGGADLFNLDLVSRIDKERFEVSVITTLPSKSEWRQRFEEHVIDLFDLSTFLNVRDWNAFIHYYIQSRNIDVVMVSNSYYGYYLIPWLRKEFPTLPIVDFVHMEEWYWRAGGYARTSSALGDVIDKTYVISQHLKDVLTNDFQRSPSDIEVVYLNVDENYYNPEQYQPGVIRAEANIAPDDPVVLFPCRIHPQKRPFLMLEIAAETRKLIPNIRFFVVGNGPNLLKLREEVVKRGLEQTVLIFGPRKDMPQFYRDSDLTLICSIKEGLALTSYESLAMGVPVISADVGAQKELIDEQVGCLLPLLQDEVADFNNLNYSREEVIQYVKAIQRLLTDQQGLKVMKVNCRQRIIDHFTKQKMIRQMEEEFLSLKQGIGAERRKQISDALSLLPNLVDDYLTIYLEWFESEYNSMITPYTAADFAPVVKNKKTLIWGAGTGGRKTLEHLQDLDITVQGFIDKDPSKSGSTYCELPIYSPAYVLECINSGAKPFIFIGSMYYDAIKNALEDFGLNENIDFLNCSYVF